jgi:hypothetical protein
MTLDAARKWLIVANLVVIGAQLVFLFLAPALGYPLQSPKNLELLQIITPVFVGYLGAAAHFVFKHPAPAIRAKNQYLGLLIKGPFIVYGLAAIAIFVNFGLSNRVDAQIGDGMSVETLTGSMTLCLAVLTGVTGVLNAYLFASPQPT